MRNGKLARPVSRMLALAVLWWFTALQSNPLVRIEAILGLSPSPSEKLFGIKGPFSGMTEGMYQLAHGRVRLAIAANSLTPFVATLVVACLVTGYRPRIRTKRHEMLFFLSAVTAAVLVNWLN